jgi:hypothetical protein
MPLSGSPGGRVHVCVCVPIVAVRPMRAAFLLGVACLRVFVWPLSVSLVGFGVWYAVEVRSAGYRERCAGACRCIYYCLTVLLYPVLIGHLQAVPEISHARRALHRSIGPMQPPQASERSAHAGAREQRIATRPCSGSRRMMYSEQYIMRQLP